MSSNFHCRWPFVSLIMFVLRYLYLFLCVAIMNRTVSMILFSVLSLVYRKATASVCWFISYHFSKCARQLWEVLLAVCRVSCIESYHLKNGTFNSFTVFTLPISFPCLPVPRLQALNCIEIGRVDTHVLSHIFMEMPWGFLHSIYLLEVRHIQPFFILRYVPSIPTLLTWEDVNLCHTIFNVTVKIIMWFLSFSMSCGNFCCYVS